ncbi:MAG: ribosome rescue protein RqcH [Nitrososphaerales archaeon]
MELSGIELHYLVKEIKKRACIGYYVSNIYSITRDSIQLKLHHPTQPDIMLMISSKGIWMSKFKFDSIEQAELANTLRNEIMRARLDDVEQFGSERIVMLKFVFDDKTRYLVAEFFAGSNIILCDESMKILTLLRPIEVRHRVLKVGVPYTYPPRRGMDVFELKLEDLKALRSSNLDVARWVGRNIALPKRFVEEVIHESSIDIKKKGIELREEDVNTLYNKIVKLVTDVCDGNHKPVLVMQANIPVDASPLPLRNLGTVTPADSYMEAIDMVLSNHLKRIGESIKSEEFESKIKELERALDEQEKARKTLIERSAEMRRFAGSLTDISRRGIDDITNPAVKELIKNEFTVEEEYGLTMLSIMGEKIAIRNPRIASVVSVIYDRAKQLESGVKSIDSAKDKLLKELQKARRFSETARQKVRVIQREGREWYERYRWFYTTDGLLAVGGRDASSNSALVRRHLTDNDIIFHAEVHGSPFFILKNARGVEVNSIQEVAQATVSFSRAWKDGIVSADAYWVRSEHVKVAAPSGQFLPKGSFVIEGKRNYIRSLELKLAVGLVKVKGGLRVMCGAPDAVKKGSHVYALITPNNLSVSDAAKKIKSEFVKHVDTETAEFVKHIDLDDIIRALPSGGCKVIETSIGDNALQHND